MGENVVYLDPEIANEGVSALSNWSPPLPEARIPDYKGIKGIAKYFPQYSGRPYNHKVFPCWLYHPKLPARLIEDQFVDGDPPRLVKKAGEIAAELGCAYRATTFEERAQGFPLNRWVFTGEWRNSPFTSKFDPKNPGPGKLYVKEKDRESGRADDIAAIVAAVLGALKTGGPAILAEPTMPADVAEFEAFKAWRAAQAAPVVEEAAPLPAVERADDMMEQLVAAAKERGIKIDGRWSVARIREELEKTL